MDPVTVIATAVASVVGNVFGFLSMGKAYRYERLPVYLSPRDFFRRSMTIELILGAMALLLLIIISMTIWKAKR